MSALKKVTFKVEGFEFNVRQVYLTDFRGGKTIELSLEASTYDYTKEDWGNLMSALNVGKATVVIDA